MGCDASGLPGLPPAQRALLQGARLLVAPARLQEQLAQACPHAERLSSDRPERLLPRLRQALVSGESAVVLASGDPLWFGIGRLLVQELGAAALRFHPAPSSLQLAFARIGRPWQDARWISLHGRDPEPLAAAL
ncbi:MAG: precorrin-6y C5,15-methyltransferase (decarboxylating) subunit CbiE, partial [Prochlorococcaceae cyanobacterium]